MDREAGGSVIGVVGRERLIHNNMCSFPGFLARFSS